MVSKVKFAQADFRRQTPTLPIVLLQITFGICSLVGSRRSQSPQLLHFIRSLNWLTMTRLATSGICLVSAHDNRRRLPVAWLIHGLVGLLCST
ncbi:hypothetical protein P692DRAFT_2031638 [Suillus brevipes Sb2]|nr:hypothetical protein P692DRAFT_2031638 [Suillus brevipes Sb2]